MAARDVKEYYLKMQAQYYEMRGDLQDYEQAFKDGHISEEQLESVKEDIAAIQDNYERLRYIMYLLELPNRKRKQKRHNSQNKRLVKYFKDKKIDAESVKLENKSLLDDLREELRKLTDDETKGA